MSEKRIHIPAPSSPISLKGGVKPDRNWDEVFVTGSPYPSVPVKHFSGKNIHDEKKDHFTLARLSASFLSTLSKKTRERVAAALVDTTGGKSVADLVTQGMKIDVAQSLRNRGLHDFSAYEAVHGESRFFSELTEMDLLSSESMTNDEIRKIITSLLINKKGGPLLPKQAVETINRTYRLALDFLDLLGITPKDAQLNRKFASVEEFIAHVDSLKPGSRKNGYGMVIECAVIRAMDDVHDVLSNDRYQKLDQEAHLVLEKIRSQPGVTLKDLGEGKFLISYVPPQTKNADKFFQGTLHMREKNFFKILLKMAFNRKYTNIDSLKDLLGLRFETENPDKNHLANAIEFFAHHVFEKCEYDQKGDLVDLEDLKNRRVPVAQISHLKASTDEDIANGDLTGGVAIRWGKSGGSKTTGIIEMQFQYVGGMEGGFRTSEYYDFKKLLTASARKIQGFDIRNLKFFIRLFLAPSTGMSEKAILSRLFFPPKTPKSVRKPTIDISKKSSKEIFIDAHWADGHGFLLPMTTGTGGVRFSTLDAFTPEYYALYGRHYLTPALVDFDYLLRMYDRAEIDDKVREYRHKDWSV